jgi:hypothetical protein
MERKREMALIGFGRRVRVLVGTSALVLGLVLSGCIEVAIESEFESDGSARHSLSTTVDRTMVDDEMLGGELDFDEIEQGAHDAGLDVDRIDETDRVGVRMSIDVDDNEDLGEALNRLFNAMESDGPEVRAFSGSFTESGGGFGGTTYNFELTVDGDALFEDEEDEIDDFDMGMDMMRQFINMTYTVSMPGDITDHNGTDLGGGRVQWELPFQGTETFSAESEEGSGFPLVLIIGGGVGFLAVILVIAGGVLLMRGRTAPVSQSPSVTGSAATEPPHETAPGGRPVAETETTYQAETDDGSPDKPEQQSRPT